VSFAGVFTTGLSSTAAAVRFPHGFGATLVATAAATMLAAVLAALTARRDALGVMWAALGIWFTVGLGAGIAGIGLSHPGPLTGPSSATRAWLAGASSSSWHRSPG
jgi:hypothetical protein